MGEENKIFQRIVDLMLLVWSHLIISHQMIKLNNTNSQSFKLLSFHYGLFQVYVFDHLRSQKQSAVASFSNVPPVITKEGSILANRQTLIHKINLFDLPPK